MKQIQIRITYNFCLFVSTSCLHRGLVTSHTLGKFHFFSIFFYFVLLFVVTFIAFLRVFSSLILDFLFILFFYINNYVNVDHSALKITFFITFKKKRSKKKPKYKKFKNFYFSFSFCSPSLSKRIFCWLILNERKSSSFCGLVEQT